MVRSIGLLATATKIAISVRTRGRGSARMTYLRIERCGSMMIAVAVAKTIRIHHEDRRGIPSSKRCDWRCLLLEIHQPAPIAATKRLRNSPSDPTSFRRKPESIHQRGIQTTQISVTLSVTMSQPSGDPLCRFPVWIQHFSSFLPVTNTVTLSVMLSRNNPTFPPPPDASCPYRNTSPSRIETLTPKPPRQPKPNAHNAPSTTPIFR